MYLNVTHLYKQAAAKNANRLDQIKHEESIHVVEREVAHERLVPYLSLILY